MPRRSDRGNHHTTEGRGSTAAPGRAGAAPQALWVAALEAAPPRRGSTTAREPPRQALPRREVRGNTTGIGGWPCSAATLLGDEPRALAVVEMEAGGHEMGADWRKKCRTDFWVASLGPTRMGSGE